MVRASAGIAFRFRQVPFQISGNFTLAKIAVFNKISKKLGTMPHLAKISQKLFLTDIFKIL